MLELCHMFIEIEMRISKEMNALSKSFISFGIIVAEKRDHLYGYGHNTKSNC